MLNAIKNYKKPHGDTPQYSWGWIIFLSLFPGLLVVFMKGALTPLHGFGYQFVLIFYYSIEALILLAFIWGIGRREKNTSLKSIAPYQEKIGKGEFLIYLAIVTIIAIYFRDFFRSDTLNGIAAFAQSNLTVWPPSWAVFPNHDTYAESLSGINLWIFGFIGMLAVMAVSVMQTFYFRGVILPRMKQMGWITVLLNCILFSMFHLTSPAFWLHFVIFTFVWGVVTYMTRNVWVAVISHAIFNSYSRIIILLGLAGS